VNDIIQANNLTKIYLAGKERPPLRAVDGVDRLRSGTQQKTVIEVTLANPDGQQEKK
jgi:hypothetical protein